MENISTFSMTKDELSNNASKSPHALQEETVSSEPSSKGTIYYQNWFIVEVPHYSLTIYKTSLSCV